MPPRSDDHQDMDWYGERAKRKNQRNSRRSTWRGLAIGVVGTLAVAGAALVGGRNALFPALPAATPTASAWPFVSPYITITAGPDQLREQIAATLTEAAIFAPTATPFTIATASLTPVASATPIPPPDVIKVDWLTDNTLFPIFTLPLTASLGFQFTALAIAPDRSLRVAYAHTVDPAVACNPAESIWHIGTDYTTIKRWSVPAIGHPEALAVNQQGALAMVAFDCAKGMWSIVRLTANGQPIGVPFAIVGGASIATRADGQILVGLADFADSTAVQPHLLTLHADSATQQLIEQSETYDNDTAGGDFVALKFEPAAPDRLIALWQQPGQSDRVLTIQIPSLATPTPAAATLTVTEAIGLAAIGTPTEAPLTSGLALHTADPSQVVQLRALDFNGNQPIGLRADGRALITWDNNGLITTIPIPAIVAHAFAIDHGLVYLAGKLNP